MIAGPLLHVVDATLAAFELGSAARADIAAAIGALDPKLPSIVGALGGELGLPIAEWRARCAAVVFMFTAIQLADDLADGECTYLDEPQRRGPGTGSLLHQLVGALLLESGVERRTIASCFRDFLEVGAAQQVEVRRRFWDLESSQQAALGLNGKQWSAYLALLANGTPYASTAPRWGEAWGCALHVSGDKGSGDPRFASLTPAEQGALSMWALEQLEKLRDSPLVTLQRSATWFRTVLRAT